MSEANPPAGLRVNTSRANCPSPHTLSNRLGRLLWGVVWALCFRPTPRNALGWRRLLLRLFGARIGQGVKVMPSARIWAPWNLVMDEESTLGEYVDCYCVAPVHIGAHATISQYSHLCTATHDPSDPAMRMVSKPITIEDQVWVCADVFVGPGVVLRQGCVVGARSSVFKDLPAWMICHGTPARPVRERIVNPVNPAEK